MKKLNKRVPLSPRNTLFLKFKIKKNIVGIIISKKKVDLAMKNRLRDKIR
tara:strand:- start:7 stop:156 length:150 start_codon:yes stop_codon:yes gene_type:complete